MGFLDTVKAKREALGDGGDYVTEAETDDIIANRVPFTISAVSVRDNPFGDGEQYVLTISLAGEERLKTFNKGVQSRDETLNELIESGELDAGPVGPVTLVKEPTKRGRAVVLFELV